MVKSDILAEDVLTPHEALALGLGRRRVTRNPAQPRPRVSLKGTICNKIRFYLTLT